MSRSERMGIWHLVGLVMFGLASTSAWAAFHTFDVSEVYSNASGTIQFIEMHEADGANGQNLFTGAHLTSNANDFTFPSNLPSATTAGKRFILATTGYASVPGAVTANYTIPNNFFNPNGDTISLRATSMGAPFDTYTFTAGQLPLNGTQSLHDPGGVAANSPTNFAGTVGSLAPTVVCGNGFLQGAEACDDGNVSNNDACLNTCVVASCGDGFVRTGFEACDDGNGSNNDACLNSCVVATCGDGFTRTGVEDCDDANGSNTDACLVGCIAASCGDGFVQTGVEDCDDGNTVGGDGCSASCALTIPTVSEWGLIAFSGLLLAAGGVMIARRSRQVTAH